MTQENDQSLPPFRTVAQTSGFLSDAEIHGLIADHVSLLKPGKVRVDDTNAAIRRSQIAFLGAQEKYRWVYERLWQVAQECNRRFFCVDIVGIEGNVQLARYDSSDQGFYDWHTDFSSIRPKRKISITVQLSSPEDYEGGDLELMFTGRPDKVEKAKGTLIAFPSFALHRVSPVTRGTRWSLVAWIVGARWN